MVIGMMWRRDQQLPVSSHTRCACNVGQAIIKEILTCSTRGRRGISSSMRNWEEKAEVRPDPQTHKCKHGEFQIYSAAEDHNADVNNINSTWHCINLKLRGGTACCPPLLAATVITPMLLMARTWSHRLLLVNTSTTPERHQVCVRNADKRRERTVNKAQHR